MRSPIRRRRMGCGAQGGAKFVGGRGKRLSTYEVAVTGCKFAGCGGLLCLEKMTTAGKTLRLD